MLSVNGTYKEKIVNNKLPLRIRLAIATGAILSIPVSIILVPLLLPPLFIWSCIQVWRMNNELI